MVGHRSATRPSSTSAGVMLGSKWLFSSCLSFLLLSLHPNPIASTHKHKIYSSDVNEEEVAIDQLEDYFLPRAAQINPYPPPYQNDFPNFHSALKIGEKMEFGVSPKDPRYYLPSSVLREGVLSPDIAAVAVPEGGSRNDPLLRAGELHPAHHSPLVRELFSRFSPLIYGTGEGSPSGLVASEYGGHKFGPLPSSHQGQADSESSDGESVSFLQKSDHEAEIPYYVHQKEKSSGVMSDFYFIALVAGCTAATVCAVVGAGICYLRLHKNKRDAADAEYPAYGVTGPCGKDFSPAAADRKLAQSAHMFHYQHQKQQMIALEKSSGDERHCSASDVDSEEEGEEGDYTVYECPGLAPTGEMEVKNPLFSDDPTPAATPATRQKGPKDEGDNKREEE